MRGPSFTERKLMPGRAWWCAVASAVVPTPRFAAIASSQLSTSVDSVSVRGGGPAQ